MCESGLRAGTWGPQHPSTEQATSWAHETRPVWIALGPAWQTPYKLGGKFQPHLIPGASGKKKEKERKTKTTGDISEKIQTGKN